MNSNQKPLFEIKPEWLWKEQRVLELKNIIVKHSQTNSDKLESIALWIDEAFRLLLDLEELKNKGTYQPDSELLILLQLLKTIMSVKRRYLSPSI